MLVALLIVQALILATLLILLFRRNQAPGESTADPRLETFLGADIPAQLARVDTRAEMLDGDVRKELLRIREEARKEADRSRQAAEESSAALRREVLGSVDVLGKALREGLESFRTDNRADGAALRTEVVQQLKALTDRFINFTSDTNRHYTESRNALDTRLAEMGRTQSEQQEKLRGVVEEGLKTLNRSNEVKLEEMRQTVDEKLHATLQTRLTESFGQVTDQLTKVHAGLGEMSKLSAGVDDLSRIFTNVKTRGTIGEVMLETLLKQMLAPNQYAQNAKVRPNTQEMVEFAVKLPTAQGEMLLPIDSKFPREIWERLQASYESGKDVVSAGKAFESAIRNEGKKICEKYIAPPHTTTFAIMFLPSEALYAEVMRRDGLQADIQQNCRVTIAGPSTLSAILNSFQMGFHMLQMQQKGDEVWKVLANARREFATFQTLMDKMSDDVARVQGTIDKVGVRTRAINKTLRDVKLDDAESATLGIPVNNTLPMLAAAGEED